MPLWKRSRGTVAAQILIERGMSVDDAISAVRKVRPEAIENYEQERYLRLLDGLEVFNVNVLSLEEVDIT